MTTKVLLIILAVAMVAVLAPQAHAQGGLFAAWQDAKDLNSGFGIGATAPADLGLLRIDPRISWYNYSNRDVNVFPLEIAGEINLGIVYGGLGASYYLIDSDIEDRWGFFAVAGAKLSLGRVTLFGDLIWRGSETLQSIDFDGAGLNLGILFF